MTITGRVEKAETALYVERARAEPCALHALGALQPDPKDPAGQFAGGCHECGEPMFWNVEKSGPRERELMAELYGVGSSLATLTASRRSAAALLWLQRQFQKRPAPPPYHGLMRALDEEQLRRFIEAWTEHLKTVSDEMLELMADEDFRALPDAEIEAIIWPAEAAAT